MNRIFKSAGCSIINLDISDQDLGSLMTLVEVIGSEKIHSLGYLYVIMPAGLGALTMLVVALLVNNILKKRSYRSFGYNPFPG